MAIAQANVSARILVSDPLHGCPATGSLLGKSVRIEIEKIQMKFRGRGLRRVYLPFWGPVLCPSVTAALDNLRITLETDRMESKPDTDPHSGLLNTLDHFPTARYIGQVKRGWNSAAIFRRAV